MVRAHIVVAVLLLAGCSGLAENGSAPRLTPIDNQQVLVGEQLTFVVTGTDPDGDSLTFKIEGRPEGAQFIAGSDGQSAIFTWIPEVTDSDSGGKEHPVTFYVQDDSGLWDSQKVTITVVPQGEAYFLNPPGYVLDLAEQGHIEFLVQVKDDSATQVDLSIAAGPEGAYIEQTGSKQAYFYWRPTPEQIDAKLFWYVRFQATGYAPDAAHAGQEDRLYDLLHDISIVITNPDYAGCPGTAPVITHAPLGDQHWDAGSSPPGYALAADIAEADSVVKKAVVHYTTGNPDTDAGWQTAALSPEGDGAFAGYIPKVSAGAGTLVHYYLEAWDDDDFSGSSCDHKTRQPKQGHHTFVAYDDGFDTACLEDSWEDNDAFGEAWFFEEPAGSYPGLRACAGDADFFGFIVTGAAFDVTVTAHGNGEALQWQPLAGDGTPVAETRHGSGTVSVPATALTTGVLVVELSADQAVSYDLAVAAQESPCSADPLEPDDSVASAPLLGEGDFEGLTVCGGDVDFYRFEVPAGTFLSALVSHAAVQGDLDLFLLDSDGETVLDSAQTGQNNELVEYNVVTGGTHYLRVEGFNGATNSYHLTVTYDQQTQTCQEDSFAPNQYSDDSVMMPPASYPQVVACPDREDWFAVGLNGGETVFVRVAPAAGLATTLFDPDDNVLCSGQPQSGELVLSCSAPTAGRYTFRIANAGTSAIAYDLTLAVQDPAGPCQNDRFENNDQPADGAAIDASVTTWLKLCGDDVDWFHFDGYPMDVVFIGLVFDAAQGLADVALFDETGNSPLATSNSTAGQNWLEVELPAFGTYAVAVSASQSGLNLPYNLLIWLN